MSLQVNEFVPVLVLLLDASPSAECMLLACRALTYMMEIMPQSCNAVVHVCVVLCMRMYYTGDSRKRFSLVHVSMMYMRATYILSGM